MVNDWNRVFVTVGTTRFDKLVDSVLKDDTLKVLSSRGCSQLTIQLGSTPCPQIDFNRFNIDINTYDYKNSILEDIESADLVIGHAGAGTSLEVLRHQKPLLVVINEDLMSNHQKELADRLKADGYLSYCNTNTLADSLINFDTSVLNQFPEPNPLLFANFIDNIFFRDNQKPKV